MFQLRFWPSVRLLACASARLTNKLYRFECNRLELVQARPPQCFHIAFALGFVDRHLARHPGKSDVWLHTANLLDHGLGEIVITCHGGGRSKQAIGADEISTLP